MAHRTLAMRGRALPTATATASTSPRTATTPETGIMSRSSDLAGVLVEDEDLAAPESTRGDPPNGHCDHLRSGCLFPSGLVNPSESR